MTEDELGDGWIVFESDADLDHWLNMLDRETVFELDLPAPCPEDE